MNAIQWLGQFGAAQRTQIRHDGLGLRAKLVGLPSAVTDSALADLARAQSEAVKVSTSRIDVSADVSIRLSADVRGDDLANLIAPPVVAPVNRVAQNGSAKNGRAAAKK